MSLITHQYGNAEYWEGDAGAELTLERWMGKMWPTAPGTGRTRLLPPSQCLDSTITAPTNPWHFQTGNKPTKTIGVASCFSQRWTCSSTCTHPHHFHPKNQLYSLARGSRSEHAAISQLEAYHQTLLLKNKANKGPQTALIIWDNDLQPATEAPSTRN